MTYRGYEIEMCRTQCELWSLNDDGDADSYVSDCAEHDSHVVTYFLLEEDRRVLGSGNTLAGVKKYADALALGLSA